MLPGFVVCPACERANTVRWVSRYFGGRSGHYTCDNCGKRWSKKDAIILYPDEHEPEEEIFPETQDGGEPEQKPGELKKYTLELATIDNIYGPPPTRVVPKDRYIYHRLVERLSPVKIARKYNLPLKAANYLESKFYGKEARKEVASHMERARQLLPKDKLGSLLAAGKTQSAIAEEYGVPFWAISSLKKAYWRYGFDPKYYEQTNGEANEMPDNANIMTEKANGETREEITELQVSDPEPDLEGFAWAVPVRMGSTRKYLKIKPHRISLSAAAVKALQSAQFVRIGVSAGILALVPGRNSAEGYKLSGNGKYAQLGGGALVRFLNKHGFGPGEYELEQNKKGWLVASRSAVN